MLTDDVGVYSMVYKQCEYLWLKGGFYYFRRHVPVDVQQHYERSCVVICLKTRSKASALRASRSKAFSRCRENLIERGYLILENDIYSLGDIET